MGGTVNMGGKVLYTAIHLYNSCTQYSTLSMTLTICMVICIILLFDFDYPGQNILWFI